jgi:hypothetical protein
MGLPAGSEGCRASEMYLIPPSCPNRGRLDQRPSFWSTYQYAVPLALSRIAACMSPTKHCSFRLCRESVSVSLPASSPCPISDLSVLFDLARQGESSRRLSPPAPRFHASRGTAHPCMRAPDAGLGSLVFWGPTSKPGRSCDLPKSPTGVSRRGCRYPPVPRSVPGVQQAGPACKCHLASVRAAGPANGRRNQISMGPHPTGRGGEKGPGPEAAKPIRQLAQASPRRMSRVCASRSFPHVSHLPGGLLPNFWCCGCSCLPDRWNAGTLDRWKGRTCLPPVPFWAIRGWSPRPLLLQNCLVHSKPRPPVVPSPIHLQRHHVFEPGPGAGRAAIIRLIIWRGEKRFCHPPPLLGASCPSSADEP